VGRSHPPCLRSQSGETSPSYLRPPFGGRRDQPRRKREDSWELSLSALGKRSHTPSVVADATTSPPFGSASGGETNREQKRSGHWEVYG
jgi:hypothetical protein